MAETMITVQEDNDPSVDFTIYTNESNATPLNLTGYSTIEFFVKDRAAGADGPPVATLAGGDVRVTAALTGQLSVDLVAADLAVPGKRWYRLDGVNAGKRLTLAYGWLTVVDT